MEWIFASTWTPIRACRTFSITALRRQVRQVLASPGEDRASSEDSPIAMGQTQAGRYLRVIYVPDPDGAAAFVVTAFELKGKSLRPIGDLRDGGENEQPKYPAGWDQARVQRLVDHYENMSDDELWRRMRPLAKPRIKQS